MIICHNNNDNNNNDNKNNNNNNNDLHAPQLYLTHVKEDCANAVENTRT